jgi:hypothetical protein
MSYTIQRQEDPAMTVHIHAPLGDHRLSWLSLAAPAVLAIMLNAIFGVFLWNEVVRTQEQGLIEARRQAALLRCDRLPNGVRRDACRAGRATLPSLLDDTEPAVNVALR